MIALILMGASFLSLSLSLSMSFTGVPHALAEWIDGMNMSPLVSMVLIPVIWPELATWLPENACRGLS